MIAILLGCIFVGCAGLLAYLLIDKSPAYDRRGLAQDKGGVAQPHVRHRTAGKRG